ncbi:MAG: hypothetical protein LBQ57_13555, partial [Spirochaetales bacterium]|nr:hypothetical protein [Spirochaetales bacterium]
GDYELAADITLPGGWTPLGTGDAPFSGVFDGAGHTITLTGFDTAGVVGNSWSTPWGDDTSLSGHPVAAGIFSYTENASIKNLNITVNTSVSFEINSDNDFHFTGIVAGLAKNTMFRDITVSGGGLFKAAKTDGDGILIFGGIAGFLEACKVYDCVVDIELEAEVTGAEASVGGLAGFGHLEGCFIENSAVKKDVKAVGTLSGGTDIGGLAGRYTTGHIKNSYMEGDVYAETNITDGAETSVGGLVGSGHGNNKSIIIENSHATGDVTAVTTGDGTDDKTAAGGIMGYTSDEGGGSTLIKNSYAAGTVSASADTGHVEAGGIAGRLRYDNETQITDSYASGDVEANAAGSAWASAGGIIGQANSYGGSLSITRCYATGTVTTNADPTWAIAGGIIGGSFGNGDGGSLSVEQCYARDNIVASSSGSKMVGGILGSVGPITGRSISGCAVLSASVSGSSGYVFRIAPSGAGITFTDNIALDTMTLSGNPSITSDPAGVHGESKTSAELSQQETYADLGWDFPGKWKMQDGYPVLSWQ